MATDDRQILVTGKASAPADFLVPGNGQITPKAINAVYDGTGAATAFLPTLEVVSDAGVVVARCPTTNAVAAGGSAEVSWFPSLGQSLSKPLPPGFNTLYDFTVTVPQPGIDTAVDGTGAGPLPTTYELLELSLFVRTDDAAAQSELLMTVNGDSSFDYDERELFAFSAFTIGTDNFQADTFWIVGIAGSAANTGYPSLIRMNFPNYGTAGQRKIASGTISTPGETAANNIIAMESYGWRGTDPIDRFACVCQAGGVNLLAGSRLTIWAR
jgi:hypothetical protein